MSERTDELNRFYSELTEDGKAFVDLFAVSLEAGMQARMGKRGVKVQFGRHSARQLALACLEHLWDGRMPVHD